MGVNLILSAIVKRALYIDHRTTGVGEYVVQRIFLSDMHVSILYRRFRTHHLQTCKMGAQTMYRPGSSMLRILARDDS